MSPSVSSPISFLFFRHGPKASSCNVNSIISVRNGPAFSYQPGKKFWKHDGFLPLQSGDHPVEFFTFGGGSSAPLEDGVYFAVARVVARAAAGADAATDQLVLQLFANNVMSVLSSPSTIGYLPPFSSLDDSHAFYINVSQYRATTQQLIRVQCFYSNDNTRFLKTHLPTTGKHVVVHAHLARYKSGRFLLRVIDITLGPDDGLQS